MIGGFMFNTHKTQTASAQEACVVDNDVLTKLYNVIFHRPLDAGANFHLNKPLDTVLNTLANSDEHRQYTGVFKAVKALEEARRAPGQITATNHARYKNIIDSSLSTVAAWSDTLPEQALANRVIGPDQARAAVQAAYDRLDAGARAKAEFGLFQATDRIGRPSSITAPTN